METADRRYDIDWIRVIAIGLLLIYHVSIGFQPWGMMIAFITNEEPWESLWIPMTLLNIWRIPLLFFVSGMGVYFAMQDRTWKQLLSDRIQRILLPFLFGAIVITPLHIYLWEKYYQLPVTYEINPGHLWFLGNIFLYLLILIPFFYYLKRNEKGMVVRGLKRLFSTPFGLVPVIIAFILEAILIHPFLFEMYAMTLHGFFLGLLAFFFGFCFVLSGKIFWNMILKYRWLFFSVSLILFLLRTIYFKTTVPISLTVIESNTWVITVLAFGYRYLNHPGKLLSYLSEAAYPIYILHMAFLYLASTIVFPWEGDVRIKFLLVLVGTVIPCFAFFEIIKRLQWLRPLFGMKLKKIHPTG